VSGGDSGCWIRQKAGSGAAFQCYNAAGNASADGANFGANTWTHICGIASGDSITVYTNGSPGTPETLTGGPAGSSGSFYVGGPVGTFPWNGAIDSAFIWNFDIGQHGVDLMYADGQGSH
jgi:hypothetical protein